MVRSVILTCLIGLSSTVIAESPAPVVSAQDASAQAKARYEKGMAHFQLEEYDKAILEWEEGFRTRPVPEFLYNLAQAYRLSKVPDRALTLYRRYLNMKPNAPNKGEVERQIAQLERAVSANTRAANAPPYGTMPTRNGNTPTTPRQVATTRKPEPEPTPVAKSEPAAAPTATTTTSTSTTATVVTTDTTLTQAPPAKKPLIKKAWFWGAVAGGVVVIAVAVGVGVAVGTAKTVDKASTLPPTNF